MLLRFYTVAVKCRTQVSVLSVLFSVNTILAAFQLMFRIISISYVLSHKKTKRALYSVLVWAAYWLKLCGETQLAHMTMEIVVRGASMRLSLHFKQLSVKPILVVWINENEMINLAGLLVLDKVYRLWDYYRSDATHDPPTNPPTHSSHSKKIRERNDGMQEWQDICKCWHKIFIFILI